MFWIIAAILMLIALSFIVPSLLKPPQSAKPAEGNAVGSDDGRRLQNIQIAKEQLEDIELRFEKGEMDEAGYQAARDELEITLYEDVQQSEQDVFSRVSKKSVVSTLAIALLIPAISVGMYLNLGNSVFTGSFSSKQAAKDELQKNVPKKEDGTPDIDLMVVGLQKKMDANPENSKGWFMLGRSYMVLKRYPEAVKAYENAYKLLPESANVMLSLADSLSMASGGDIVGRPTQLIKKALIIEPNNLTALWLSGMAARQQRDYVTAIQHWQKVLQQLNDPSEIQEVNSLIADAKKQLSPAQLAQVKQQVTKQKIEEQQPKTNKAQDAIVRDIAAKDVFAKGIVTKGISVRVSLADNLKAKANPNDLVFVYAKAVSGPPMPLAAARKQVKDLPFDIVLDDSMAMIPTLKLSGFKAVIVGARISKSGQPIAQNGDLFTEEKPVKAGDKVVLKIDSIVDK